MCNIAGYVGSRPAAPILLEMMEREEGFAGGYYTGIATVYQNRLYCRKVVGGVRELMENTDAAALPGTVGILHSRSNSGGGREWAHPFLNPAGDFAYVANGSPGRFQDNDCRISQAAARLYGQGCRFTTASPSVAGYPSCAPGCHIHTSEAMCFLIDLFRKEGLSDLDAMSRVFMDYPAEIVGLSLSAAHPDRITAARICQPMMVGWDADGAYLATTAMAFPQGLRSLFSLPENTAAEIFAGRITLQPFKHPPASLSPTIPWDAVLDRVRRRVEQGPANMVELLESTDCLFSQEFPAETVRESRENQTARPIQVSQQYHAVYEALRILRERGELTVETRETDGAESPLRRRTFYCKSVGLCP